MARELRLDVTSKSNDAGLKEAARNVDHLRKEADRLGDEFKQAERAAAGLDRELIKTKAATAALAAEFAKTKDVGIKKDLDAQRVAARELQRLRADMVGDAEKDAKAANRAFDKAAAELRRMMDDSGRHGATTFAAAFQGGIINAFSSLPGEAKLAIANTLAGAIIVGSAAIGAAVNGAIVSGIGAGAIAAGIAGQANDPVVRAAWSGLVDDVKSEFSSITDVFARPAAYSANIFRTEWRKMLPGLGEDLEGLSKFVVPLASGLSQAFSNMGPGLSDALREAGPLLQVVANELPKFGKELGHAFSILAKESEGAADGIRFLFIATETLVVGISALIAGLTRIFHALVVFQEAMTDVADTLFGWIPLLGEATEAGHKFWENLRYGKQNVEDLSTVGRDLTKDAAALGAQFYNTADAARALDDAFNRLFGTQMSVDQANLAVKEGLLQLKETLKDNGRTLDDNTEKGQANVRGILEQIRRLDEKRQADIAAGNGTKEATDRANAAYASQVASLRALLIQMGYIPSEVDKILGAYAKIPTTINTTITTTYRTVGGATKGVYDAGDREDRRYGSGGKRAGGGPVMAGMSYIVGDGGRPEVFFPGVDGYIAPSLGAAARMVGGVERGGSTPITVHVYGSVVTERQLVEVIESTVSRLGGSPGLLGIKAA